jgi:hypothetical protein
MRRRDLIAAFDAAAEWPLSMRARPVASSVIGLRGAEPLGLYAEGLRRFIDFRAPTRSSPRDKICRIM